MKSNVGEQIYFFEGICEGPYGEWHWIAELENLTTLIMEENETFYYVFADNYEYIKI